MTTATHPVLGPLHRAWKSSSFRLALCFSAVVVSILVGTLSVYYVEIVGTVSQRLDALIGGGIAHFLTHAETRDSFDASARRLLVEVIESRPGLIGDTVRLSLSEERLPTRELVRQIEDKVGDELQWIRVNGAVIGGLAAGAIALVRYALG